MKYLCITREARYSPNMGSLDAAIMAEVVKRLAAKGADVDIADEGSMLCFCPCEGYNAVFTMARDVERLARFRTAAPCINSPQGVITCCRKGEMANTLSREGIEQPPYIIMNARAREVSLPYPLWVKNGSSCAQTAADTVFVTNCGELLAATEHLIGRGVREWIVQRHEEGDLVKFYGVEGTAFFRWHYADPGHSKHGWERVNGTPRGTAFSVDSLKQSADKAARALGVPVYGGDCVVGADGTARIIDFNDWPSFYCCRAEAAAAIVERTIMAHKKGKR